VKSENQNKKMIQEPDQFSALKILKHLDRVNDYREGRRTYPVSVDLSVSNFCNQNCIWCYYRNYLAGARVMLTKERLIKLIDELASLGIKGINFSGGGEPLTHPNLVELMEYAHSAGIDVGMITNGVLLDEERIARLTKIAKFIRISLSSSTAASYAKFHKTPGVNFAKLMNNLALLGRYGAGSDILTGVLFLLETGTKGELLDTVKLVKKSGLKFIEIRSIKNTPVFTPGALPDQLNDLTQQAIEVGSDDFKVIVRNELFRAGEDFGKSYKTCHVHEFVTSISAEGDVYLCCEFEGRKEYAFGNINKISFADIWTSEQRKAVVGNLNLNKCFACCKGDGVNILFDRVDRAEHSNFI